jgi:SAM-dependent MidA family methyltransferase
VEYLDWRSAWRDALYGPSGFFAKGERPADHFRTSPLVGPELAQALAELLDRVDFALHRPDELDFVDLGAGGGELAAQVWELGGRFGGRLRVTAVELTRPALPPGVDWSPILPDRVKGLLVGHEWLDSVPCRVVTRVDGRLVEVHVSRSGEERIGDEFSSNWVDRWWPLGHDGQRAEIGDSRDKAWSDAVSRVVAGAALAIDYGHVRDSRPSHGTLTGYRAGRQVTPIPDGSCDITAHVAFDSVAAAVGGTLMTQRKTLAELGMTADPPAASLASADPMGWLASSARAGRVAELRDPNGLGAFHWLLTTRD